MKRILSVLGLTIALSFGTAAFAQTEGHSHHAQSNQSPSKVTKSDGSTVEIIVAPDGTKTEIRTFERGDISRITRTTNGDGMRVVVEYRDGRKADLTDENDIEQAMDATADVMLAAADKAWKVTKAVGEEVADKTEDVADKTVDVTKKAVDKTKDVTKDVAKETVEVTKKVADKTEDVVDKTIDKSKEVGKEVADKTGKVAVKGVKVTKEAGEEVADKTEDVADKTAKESVSFGRKVGRGFKKVGGWFKSIFD